MSSLPTATQPPEVAALPFIDKLEHFAEYAVLAALLVFALRKGAGTRRRGVADLHPVLAWAVAAAYAASDEAHQALVPLRQADGADLMADWLGALAGALALAYFLPPAPRPLPQEVRMAPLPHGRVAYLDEGQGPAVLYLHGWHGSKRYFRGAPSRLPGFRHLALDLLGFGDSDAPARFSYSPIDQARSVRAFAAALGVDSAAVVGHSMGGAIAVELGLLDPAFVRALVLVEPALATGTPTPAVTAPADARPFRAGLVRRFRTFNVEAFARHIVANAQAFTPELAEDALAVPLHASARALRGLSTSDLASRVGELRPPVLLVLGDASLPARAPFAQAFSAALPSASLVHIAGAGHCPMIEAPDAFYAAVGAFLAGGQAR